MLLYVRELGGDRGYDQGPDVVSPLGGATDHGDNRKMWVRRIVGVSSGGGGGVIIRAPPNKSIHKEEACDHIGEGVPLAGMYTVNGGGEDARDDMDGALMRSRCGKCAKQSKPIYTVVSIRRC